MPLEFRYRLVGFGTVFVPGLGQRTRLPLPTNGAYAEEDSEAAGVLFSNEVAVDVGGACQGYAGCTANIYDHHFARHDLGRGTTNYGSAALAVLAHASEISAISTKLGGKDEVRLIWIVTHQGPDFDACLASFLVAELLSQPAQAQDFTEWRSRRLERRANGFDPFIDWRIDETLNPNFRGTAPEGRSLGLYQLASYAARVDQCKADDCPREASLRFIFQAAQARGRFMLEPSDSRMFFEDVLAIIKQEKLNPLFDAFRPLSRTFAAEIEYVRNQEALYLDDMRRRATNVSVSVAQSESPYSVWRETVKVPFWVGDQISPIFKALCERDEDVSSGIIARRESLDGILVRDPRCRFFKDWVRQDTASSPRGNGYIFTAITYPPSTDGKRRYVFSLDPEFAVPRRLHLYDLWATLQQGEGPRQTESGKPEAHRRDVLARAADGVHGLNDPWYDGNAYSASIIDTPNRGSILSKDGEVGEDEDAVMHRVGRWISRSFYQSPEASGFFYRWSELSDRVERVALRAHLGCGLPSVVGVDDTKQLIFAQVMLNPHLTMSGPGFAQSSRQIGEALWRILARQSYGVPVDFEERHLIRGDGWVAVWNRRGVAVAAKDTSLIEVIREDIARIAEILHSIALQINAPKPSGSLDEREAQAEARLNRSRQTLKQLTELECKSRTEAGRSLRLLLDAVAVSSLARQVDVLNNTERDELATLRDDQDKKRDQMHEEHDRIREDQEKRRDNLLATVLAMGTALSLGIAILQTDWTKAGDMILVWSSVGVVVLFMVVYLIFCFRGAARGHDSRPTYTDQKNDSGKKS